MLVLGTLVLKWSLEAPKTSIATHTFMICLGAVEFSVWDLIHHTGHTTQMLILCQRLTVFLWEIVKINKQAIFQSALHKMKSTSINSHWAVSLCLTGIILYLLSASASCIMKMDKQAQSISNRLAQNNRIYITNKNKM